MKGYVILILTSFIFQSAFCQLEPVEVAELTIKIRGASTKEIYYGFAKGDEIIFDFEEVKGKSVKEIEITELPSNSKFMDYKSNSINNKRIKVNKKALYKFSFYNSSIAARICKIKVKRIPKSESLISFNTDWEWKTVYDTTYFDYKKDSLIGYDTIHYKEKVKELVKTEQIEEMILNKNQRVHSYYNQNKSKVFFSVNLPANRIERYREEKTIAWAYWIGVGEESRVAYARNVKSIGNVTTTVTSTFFSPLAGLAVGTATDLMMPVRGDDVAYWFIPNYNNAQAFYNDQTFYQFDQGKGIAAFGRNTDKLQGQFFIGLYNDNQTVGIDVDVKIVVVREIKIYEDKEYDREKIKPKYVSLNKKRMKIHSKEIRINAEE